MNSVIAQCVPSPADTRVLDIGPVAGELFFSSCTDGLEATVNLWGLRFDGAHGFEPRLVAPSGYRELEDRLRALFADRVRRLIDGEEVKVWGKKHQLVWDEIRNVTWSLSRRTQLVLFSQLLDRKKGLIAEGDLISKRLGEFKSAMNCVLAHLEGKNGEEGSGGSSQKIEESGEEDVQIFSFGEGFDWNRVYSLVSRERRRLEDGLPIYAYRKEILRQIHCQQVCLQFCL